MITEFALRLISLFTSIIGRSQWTFTRGRGILMRLKFSDVKFLPGVSKPLHH